MLVRLQEDGSWTRWVGPGVFEVMVDEVVIKKFDDDNTEFIVKVADVGLEPYAKHMQLDSSGVEIALANGAWTQEYLTTLGLAVPVPFVTPEGKVRVGGPRYEGPPEGPVQEVYDMEDPAPPGPLDGDFRVTTLQARRALRQAGLKAQVDAYVGTLSEEDQEAWDYAMFIQRDSTILEAGRVALGMTQEQMDQLFLLAASMPDV